MIKLRFDNLTLGKFNSFKLVPKKRVIREQNKKLTTKLVKGICIKEGDIYKIKLDITTLKPDIISKGQPDILLLEFTEESYDIKNMTSVFSRVPDKNGKYTRYIRSESKAKFHYGSNETYIPFCVNWVCSGHIVRRNGKMMFDFNECISPNGYSTFIHKDEED